MSDQKIKISKIEFSKSESSILEDREFKDVFEADLAVLTATRHRCSLDSTYIKTWYSVEWEDGEVITGRLDVNRTYNLSRELATLVNFYTGDKPEWMERGQWNKNKAKFNKFKVNREF